MTNSKFYRSNGNFGQFIIGSLFLIALFLGLFWIARGVFTLLSYAAPVLLIAALIINYKVVTGYARWLLDVLRDNVILGLIYSFLSVIGFPILSAYLLFKALAVKKLDTIEEEMKRQSGNYTEEAEFEILDEEPLDLNTEEKPDRYKKLFDQEDQT